ncbi:alpha/beta hydrolase [Flavobacterium sp. MFBS3-15]|uniref:alpha/beta hydrolase n=1 Tax=Flavobacterium sp. MFBS3-15 TaxID=2989816 RepID=UPI002235ABBF|nr:alpha/beta hydrolase [Flavobacterium sp. MFBS3-15]MCW4468868.1 alpha/beta hydrolase [Flavobacterium sp. MFBS3-15]
MSPLTTNTIIFITGAFLSHHVWDEWILWFKDRGYNCIAPAWPYKDDSAEKLRQRRPNDNELAGIRLHQLLDHYTTIIEKEPQKPIVIGHSLGGLVVQALVNKNAVAAGVAIHSIPPKDSLSFDWPSLTLVLKSLTLPGSSKQTYLIGMKEWNKSVANGMSADEQRDSYEKYAVPASRHVFSDFFTKAAKIDFKKQHPPLLFISGTEDKIIPFAANYSNYLKYDRYHSVTGHKKFVNRNHLVLVMEVWEEEAGYIADWLDVVSPSPF